MIGVRRARVGSTHRVTITAARAARANSRFSPKLMLTRCGGRGESGVSRADDVRDSGQLLPVRRGSGKPRLVYPGARFVSDDASTPVSMSW
jgi:hypothetical protein